MGSPFIRLLGICLDVSHLHYEFIYRFLDHFHSWMLSFKSPPPPPPNKKNVWALWGTFHEIMCTLCVCAMAYHGQIQFIQNVWISYPSSSSLIASDKKRNLSQKMLISYKFVICITFFNLLFVCFYSMLQCAYIM